MNLADEIIRSRRRSIGIMVRDDGRVVVRAPLHAPDRAIQDALAARGNWIAARRQVAEERRQELAAMTFAPGSVFYFLGEKYALKFDQELTAEIIFDNAFRAAPAAPVFIKRRMRAWYQQTARKIIGAKVNALAAAFELKHRAVKINSANQRWGSCTCKGTLNFPWRLIMCPEPALDYVVAHEVAHLKRMDHSPHFWQLVEIMCPDYRRHKQWLVAHDHLLNHF